MEEFQFQSERLNSNNIW